MSGIKAIIVGEYGLFMESLIARIKKESWEPFVITGSNKKMAKRNKDVIEEYNFKYQSDNIQYILESVHPEVVIFSGALDPNFLWVEQLDAVNFNAGLNNILISAAKSGVKRFVYVSSTKIYDEETSGIINENSPAHPNDIKGVAIKNGEDISLRYNQEEGMEVVVLRCSEAYGMQDNYINDQNFYTRLCLDVFRKEAPYIDAYKTHDNIHINDLIEGVFKAVTVKRIPSKIYNICSGESVTERHMLEKIYSLVATKNKVRFINKTPKVENSYSNQLAQEELGFNIKHPFSKSVKNFLVTMNGYKDDAINKNKDGYFERVRNNLHSIFGWAFPYIETILFFIVVQIIVLLTEGSTYMQAIDFYLLYVVFIAIVYGKGQTITALLLSLLGKIFLVGRTITFVNAVVDYNTYIWTLQLLIIGMGVGYIRDRYQQYIDDKEESLKYLQAELSEIKEINQSNAKLKKTFEDRIINYQDSFARIHSIVSQLDGLQPDKIMFATVDVVSEIMKSGEVVIYSIDKGNIFGRLVASSNDTVHNETKSIRLDSLGDIYEEINKNNVYINQSMDNSKPSMAGGVYYENQLQTIVMIWSLPLENMTLYHMNLFSVVLNLVGQAMHRANEYIEESRLNRYVQGTNILNKEAFKKVIAIKEIGADKEFADYSLLEIITENRSLRELSDLIVPIARQHDYLGIGENDELYLLLSNTNEDEAKIVMVRLVDKGVYARPEEGYLIEQ